MRMIRSTKMTFVHNLQTMMTMLNIPLARAQLSLASQQSRETCLETSMRTVQVQPRSQGGQIIKLTTPRTNYPIAASLLGGKSSFAFPAAARLQPCRVCQLCFKRTCPSLLLLCWEEGRASFAFPTAAAARRGSNNEGTLRGNNWLCHIHTFQKGSAIT
jgi:hypothetical protein